MVVTPFAVYCVVWVFSAIFAGISTRTLTAIDHLKGKFESNAAIESGLPSLTAFCREAAFSATTSDEIVHARNRRTASQRVKSAAVAVRVGCVSARGHASSALIATSKAALAALTARADHLGKRVCARRSR
jgi:hypothetical protein